MTVCAWPLTCVWLLELTGLQKRRVTAQELGMGSGMQSSSMRAATSSFLCVDRCRVNISSKPR